MKWKQRLEHIREAEGIDDLSKACWKFFGYHNFSREESVSIMKYINSVYFMGYIPVQDGDNKAEGESHRERLNELASEEDAKVEHCSNAVRRIRRSSPATRVVTKVTDCINL